MIITKLRIENFRCYEQLEMEFHKRLTVIIGSNGVGKTSILESMVVALGTYFTALDGLSGVSIEKKDSHLVSYLLGQTIDVQAQYPVTVAATGLLDVDGQSKSVTWTRRLVSEKGSTTVKEAKELIEIVERIQEKLRKGDAGLLLPILAYYGTNRLWAHQKNKKYESFKANNRIHGYIDSLDGISNIQRMLGWFQKKTIEKYQRADLGINTKSELDVVYQAMEKCYYLVTGYEDIRMQYNLNTNEIDVSYTDKHNRRLRIPLSQLSDGYKSTISLIADIAYRMAVLNPQLEERAIEETTGIVLIDEVDLHLHPAWQHRILHDLMSIFPKVQFIVSTHAPAVISSVKSENLVLLKDDFAYTIPNETYGSDANSILSEIMSVPERTPEIAAKFLAFYEALSQQDYDGAESILDEIDESRNYHDKEVAACRVKLKLERIRGGRR